MQLSTKGRYGLRAMVDLADHCENAPVSISAISTRQGLSVTYLEQLLAKLRKAGLVQSVRGAQGGYVLAKVASEISVGDILRALEGDLAPVACLADGSKPCSRAADCRTLPLWKGLNEVVSSYLSKFTVQDLIHKDPDNFDNIP